MLRRAAGRRGPFRGSRLGIGVSFVASSRVCAREVAGGAVVPSAMLIVRSAHGSATILRHGGAVFVSLFVCGGRVVGWSFVALSSVVVGYVCW